jgi:hypothetical protein
MNAATLYIKSDDEQVRKHREELARRVLGEFSVTFPSEERVLCYLNDRDDCHLKQNWGGASNRGVHWPIRGQGLHDWPFDMWGIIAGSDPITNTNTWPYASVVYLHGRTCESDIQLTMTLAHELQHFVQFTGNRQLWAIHVLLTKLPSLPTHNLRHSFDLPDEIEARIVAKRVALKVFGQTAIESHIATMIAGRSSNEDVADWEFIRGLDPNSVYDLREQTIPLVEEYRSELEYLKRMVFANDRDLGTVDLNLA